MKLPMKVFDIAIETLLRSGARRSVVYIDNKTVVMATNQRTLDGRDRSRTILVTYGAPNYRQRRFIKQCRKAKEPFPVKKAQLEYWPKRRTNK